MQDYDIALAKHVAQLGVDEIQFDYVRFPAEGDQKDAQFVFQKRPSRKPAQQDSWETAAVQAGKAERHDHRSKVEHDRNHVARRSPEGAKECSPRRKPWESRP